MAIKDHGYEKAMEAELEQALTQAFDVQPDPFRRVAIRAQLVAEIRELKATRTVQGALGTAYAVQPSEQKYAHYRQLAINSARAAQADSVARPSVLRRALAFFSTSDSTFERRLNDCIDSLVAGRASFNECLQRYPEDADKLAPLLGMAFELRSEYASLPMDKRLSGIRWRVQRAAREPQTAPLAVPQRSSGGFYKSLQWAAPLTTGVAAAFVLAFVAFQFVANDGGSGGSQQASSGPRFEQVNFSAVARIADNNETLGRYRSALERVSIAVDRNEAPSRADLEALLEQNDDLHAELPNLEGEELQAASYYAEVAAATLSDAEALVAEEDLDALVSSQEAVEASREAISETTIPTRTGDGNEEPQTDPTEEATPGDEPDSSTATPEIEEEQPDLGETLDDHRALSELLHADPPVIDATLIEDYVASLDALEAAIASEEGAADAVFLQEVIDLLGEDAVALRDLQEALVVAGEPLPLGFIEATVRLGEVITSANEALDLLEGDEASEEATAEETATAEEADDSGSTPE
ncbi:MAG: hypothetical protein WEB00_06385 [Dehalococcoidia bacterium]